jgi:hypothetical protein
LRDIEHFSPDPQSKPFWEQSTSVQLARNIIGSVEESLPFLRDGYLISVAHDAGYGYQDTYLKRETWTDRVRQEEEWPLVSNLSQDAPKSMYIVPQRLPRRGRLYRSSK